VFQISLPAITSLLTKAVHQLGNIYTWMAFVGFILFVGVLAGSLSGVLSFLFPAR